MAIRGDRTLTCQWLPLPREEPVRHLFVRVRQKKQKSYKRILIPFWGNVDNRWLQLVAFQILEAFWPLITPKSKSKIKSFDHKAGGGLLAPRTYLPWWRSPTQGHPALFICSWWERADVKARYMCKIHLWQVLSEVKVEPGQAVNCNAGGLGVSVYCLSLLSF